MSVLFVADFFSDQINGGGENNDAVLIDFLRSKGIETTCIHSPDVTQEHVDKADKVIVANFVFLSEDIKEYLIDNASYIIYEHDHKYVDTRDPSIFPEFKIPTANLVNVEFYRNADRVVVLSQICKEVMEQNLQIDTVHSIGSSLWSAEKFAYIKNLLQAEMQKEHPLAILNSGNPTKGRHAAIDFCTQRSLRFDAIGSPDPYEFLCQLATYQSLVFIPQVLETFCRLVAEARMLNCKIYTIKNLIGFMSEPFAQQTGLELVETLEKQVEVALNYFYEAVTG